MGSGLSDFEIDALVGEDPQPGVNLASRAGKRQALDDLMARAMSGLLPRGRELKSWEPDTLDERHLQAIMMRASGLPQSTIAKVMDWTDSWVSIVLNHPDAQYILTKMVSYAADEVLDIQARIKAHAGEALDKVVEVMRTTNDQRLASSNAFELLKMAGYSAVEKKEIKQEISMPTQHVDLLAAAMKESAQIRAVEGKDYRVVASSVPAVANSAPPVAPGDTGISDIGQPPANGLQDTEVLHDGTRTRSVA